MNWQDYKAEFEWDGSWRDIYVLNTHLSDWQRLLEFLRSSSYTITYTGAIKDAPLPEHIAEVLDKHSEVTAQLTVNTGSVILNCHFFTDEEIEFDMDPREVHSEIELEQILSFMRKVGQLLGKEVILTPENAQNAAIFRFIPDSGQIQYNPCNA